MAADEENDEGRGFRVTDRRRFAETGEARQDAPDEPPPSPSPEGPAAPAPQERAAGDAPVTFSTFVLGLSTQALLLLGEVQDPGSGIGRDLVGAKHVIDILGILRDKTRNNLEQSEEAMLDSILYDLRMRYVELVRPGTKENR
jgi:Domain of unknown function (DUF1844)